MWLTAGWQSWRLPTSDRACAIFVTEAGESEVPVVVLHGGPGGDAYGVAGLVAGLEQHRRVVLFDQRGSFRSPAPEASLTFDHLLDDLALLIDALGCERVDLVGHSYGAVLAAAHVSSGPTRVRRLVLVAPGALRSGHPDDVELVASQMRERMRIESDPGWADVARRFELPTEPDSLAPRAAARWWRLRDAWLFTTHPERHDQVVSGVFFSWPSGQTISATIPATYDFVTPLQSRSEAVTVVIGDHDLVDQRARLSQRWFPDDGHVRRVELSNCGHAPWVDDPDATRQALLDGLGH